MTALDPAQADMQKLFEKIEQTAECDVGELAILCLYIRQLEKEHRAMRKVLEPLLDAAVGEYMGRTQGEGDVDRYPALANAHTVLSSLTLHP